jgi:ferredoxin
MSMAMKVSVDSARCQGHGICEAVAGDFFILDEQGYCSIGIGKPVPAGREDDVRRGVESCPEQALSLQED